MDSSYPHHSTSAISPPRQSLLVITQEPHSPAYIKEPETISWNLPTEDCNCLNPRTKPDIEDFFGPREPQISAKTDEARCETPTQKEVGRPSEETPPNAVENNAEVTRVWSVTHDYLHGLQQLLAQSGSPSLSVLSTRLLQQCTSEDSGTLRKLNLVLQALALADPTGNNLNLPSHVAALMPTFRTRKDEERWPEENPLPRETAAISKVDRNRTGRKPDKFVCFLCDSVFPYKKNLIRHLQMDHGIGRCQSLLYKRLKMGEEEFRRLYMEGGD